MIPMYKFQFVDLGDLDQYVKEKSKNEKEEFLEFAIGMSLLQTKFSCFSFFIHVTLCMLTH